MRLYERFMESCTRKVLTRTEDGEGGLRDIWTDGDTFDAAIVLDSASTARIGEAPGVVADYRVTTPRGANLAFHDAFVRNSDGAGFRIVKTYDHTPSAATFDFEQYQAERWSVPE